LSGYSLKLGSLVSNQFECTPSQRPRTSSILHGFRPGKDHPAKRKTVSKMLAVIDASSNRSGSDGSGGSNGPDQYGKDYLPVRTVRRYVGI